MKAADFHIDLLSSEELPSLNLLIEFGEAVPRVQPQHITPPEKLKIAARSRIGYQDAITFRTNTASINSA